MSVDFSKVEIIKAHPKRKMTTVQEIVTLVRRASEELRRVGLVVFHQQRLIQVQPTFLKVVG